MLRALERKILRGMCGQKREKRDWRHRRPGETYYRYKLLNIVDEIKFRRLGLAGNTRTVEGEIVKKWIVNGKLHSTRSVGNPRRRWEDTAHRDDLYGPGIRECRGRAGDREE